jgi:CheY-like chemotaxis protein/predicted DNA-binding transcriptional regulator AlpA
MADKNKFVSIPKAAEKCGVDRRTLWRWVKSNKVKSFVTPGGHHRILRSEIEALLVRNGFLKNAIKSRKTILVVDDDASIRRTLKQRLTRENFNVDTASEGFKAGIKVRDMKPDLIILDLMMEGVDGFEVCRTIRADSFLKNTKVLILTGFDIPENRDRAIREGADGFLAKAVGFKTILEHIHALLNR